MQEEEYNLLKKEKLILSDGEEPSERFSITSELSQINDIDSFETNLITKRKTILYLFALMVCLPICWLLCAMIWTWELHMLLGVMTIFQILQNRF